MINIHKLVLIIHYYYLRSICLLYYLFIDVLSCFIFVFFLKDVCFNQVGQIQWNDFLSKFINNLFFFFLLLYTFANLFVELVLLFIFCFYSLIFQTYRSSLIHDLTFSQVSRYICILTLDSFISVLFNILWNRLFFLIDGRFNNLWSFVYLLTSLTLKLLVNRK